jgi:hypothetical protein
MTTHNFIIFRQPKICDTGEGLDGLRMVHPQCDITNCTLIAIALKVIVVEG